MRRGGSVRFFVGTSELEYLTPDCSLEIVVLDGVPGKDFKYCALAQAVVKLFGKL